MKIDNLEIWNFRGIQHLSVTSLGNTIIISGQNGSGKSCVFDAIRLLKSVYGGYQQNEWQHFFGEFQIASNNSISGLTGLFNDISKPLKINCQFRFSDRERTYISSNARELIEEAVWQRVLPEAFQFGGYRKSMFASQFRDKKPEVDAQVDQILPLFHLELASPTILGTLEVTSNARFDVSVSHLLNVAFSVYRPRDIGVIDYHGPQRHYSREQVQGINLNLDALRLTQSQSSLYNYNNKYNNVKSEMAGSYISALLAERADPEVGTESSGDITATMKDLFTTFFPDKKFLGPVPTKDGSLSFPVQTIGGNIHDLDELSSGEKEILYGYLRMRSSAPRNSIILLDEPELHLNPRLIRGLPEFYRKYLGDRLQNQLWLVTHSDALIREAVGKPGFNVFHMQPCGTDMVGPSQLRPLTMNADLDGAVADLVGDLASYRPGGKGLIFEGGGDSDFDRSFVAAVFPEEVRGINLISGTNKAKVKALHEVLARAYDKGDLLTKYYAIVDKDSDIEEIDAQAVRRFTWDVYHIENYLLDPSVIALVLKSLLNKSFDVELVSSQLSQAARNVVPRIVNERMKSYVNGRLVQCIDLRFDPGTVTLAKTLSDAAIASMGRVGRELEQSLTVDKLSAKEQEIRNSIEASFGDGTWKASLPGREILRQFVSLENVPVNYDLFRNLIVSNIVAQGIKPPGMTDIIRRISVDK